MDTPPPLRDYLAQRRVAIQEQMKSLKDELAEISAAESVLAERSGQPTPAKRVRGATGTGKKTLKELALEVLYQREAEGADALTILAEIERKHGLKVQRESMSPQLSRLGQEGVIVRNGLIWKLARYAAPVTEPTAPTQQVAAVVKQSLQQELDDLLGTSARMAVLSGGFG